MPPNQNPATAWPQNMHQDSLVGGVAEDDFTKFLDLDNEFEQFENMDTTGESSSLETPMGRLAFGHGGMQMQDMSNHGQDVIQNMDMSVSATGSFEGLAQPATTHSNSRQQYQRYQMYQQMNQPHHYQVPPTPVSAEMHATKYHAQIDNAGQIIFDRHQASFTPLVSPAQTPLDNTFCMPDYVVSDDFFSPLTSPAIEAQPNFASTNTTASPVDLNADHSTTSTTGSVVKKRSRKVNPPLQRSARNLKQSPVVKPQQKRRQFSLTAVPSEKLEAALNKTVQPDRLNPDLARGHHSISSEDSVSPEPLSESLMRPPPLPSNAGRSPSALRPQTSEQSLPATPAMIMRMPSKQQSSATQAGAMVPTSDIMEDIVLPDAATTPSTKILPHLDTTVMVSDDQATPTLSAKTPKLSADSTPRTSSARTANNSSESIERIKRPETRIGGRNGKKRQSVGSAAISPALRPKISPSISPLVPATGPGIAGLSAETSALYLASKSNYQNILDGTHLPGVSYPETLAENLSSKRTSHKIAEQGRRNRINLALKEIESLLPPSITANSKKEKSGSGSRDGEEGSPDKAGSSNQGASKASTVEMAIVYIKSLQAELHDTKEKLEAAEKTIAEGSSCGSQSS